MSATSRFLDAHPWALGMSYEEAMADPRYVEECGAALPAPQLSERVEAIVADQLVRMDEVFRRLAAPSTDAELRAQPAQEVLDVQLQSAPDVADDSDSTGVAA